MAVYYHPGKPGEVSHEAARAYVLELLSNPFTRRDGHLLARIADAPWTRSRPKLCAPGVMNHYLRAAALREMTQGEGRVTAPGFCRCGADHPWQATWCFACDKPVLPQPSPAVVPTGTGWPVK